MQREEAGVGRVHQDEGGAAERRRWPGQPEGRVQGEQGGSPAAAAAATWWRAEEVHGPAALPAGAPGRGQPGRGGRGAGLLMDGLGGIWGCVCVCVCVCVGGGGGT